MTQKTIQNIKSIIFALAIILGTTYVSAAWTPAPANPPANNVPAPINAGGGTVGNIYSQFKTGLITLDHLITGDLTVTDPATATISNPAGIIPAGSVLTAIGANTGKVKWAAAGGGGSNMVQGQCPSGYVIIGIRDGGVVCQKLVINASTSDKWFPHNETPNRKFGGYFPSDYDLAKKDPDNALGSCNGWCWFTSNAATFGEEVCRANGYQKVINYGQNRFSSGKNNANTVGFNVSQDKFYKYNLGGRLHYYISSVQCQKIDTSIYLVQ